MGPFSAIPLHQLSRSALLGVAVALAPAMLGACEDEREEKKEEPTEPWLKDEAKREPGEARSHVRYRVRPGARLDVALQTRRSKPVGHLGDISGYVDFDLLDLAKSRGRIEVDLSSLSMNNLPREVLPDDPEEPQPELQVLATDATGEALRWLGLGAEVDDQAKQRNRTAVYEFDSLRALSHTSAHTGARRKKDGEGERRQVYATANGELLMRGLSVQRRMSTTLHFDYPSEAEGGTLPVRVEASLRGTTTIPLAEYEIGPRGPKGNQVASKADWIGRWIASSAKITGTISLEKMGTK